LHNRFVGVASHPNQDWLELIDQHLLPGQSARAKLLQAPEIRTNRVDRVFRLVSSAA